MAAWSSQTQYVYVYEYEYVYGVGVCWEKGLFISKGQGKPGEKEMCVCEDIMNRFDCYLTHLPSFLSSSVSDLKFSCARHALVY